jgi:hypothetical protein
MSVARRGAKKSGTNTLTRNVAAILRGDASSSEMVLSIHRQLMGLQGGILGQVNPFVLTKAFRVKANVTAQSLSLGQGHFSQLATLAKLTSTNIETSYLRLTAWYVLQNVDRVGSWTNFDAKSSYLGTVNGAEAIKQLLLAMPVAEQQSLFSLRLYAALHSFSDTAIKEFLSKNLTSAWTRGRLLYPLSYYYLSLPNDKVMDQLLLHVVPRSNNATFERDVIKFLIDPTRIDAPNLASRCYLGLLSHPYDALEYLTGALEIRLSRGERPPAGQMEIIRCVAEALPDHRIARIHAVFSGNALPVVDKPSCIAGIAFPKDDEQQEMWLRILDPSCVEAPDIVPASDLMASMRSIRWTRYPDPKAFDEVHAFRKRYSALSIANLTDATCRALFMFDREDHAVDALHCVRLALFTGSVTPLGLMAPGGYELLRTGIMPSGMTEAEADRRVMASAGSDRVGGNDRVWICKANWDLSRLQFDGRNRQWAVLDTAGVLPFVGSDDGIYILFLRQLEQFQRESVAFRLAIEPKAKSQTAESFREWLFDTYGENAIAMIRLSLTPETILKLKLADNYMAALTLRVTLLEHAVQRFQFIPRLLSEEDLIQEEDALTANLSRMSVGARQFEITWASLKVDANTRNRDTYSAHEAMIETLADAFAAQVRSSSYPYSNGVSVEYQSRYAEWPLIMVLAGIIETFLSHPTSGIESILSVRIRHDAFRREFANAISTVSQGDIVNVRRNAVADLVKPFEAPIYREIQGWLDAKMHTVRKDKPHALFNLIPSKIEMSDLLTKALTCNSLDHVIDVVFEWIQPRLETQLSNARRELDTDFLNRLTRQVRNTQERLIAGREDEEEVNRVAQALTSAVTRRANEIQEWFKMPDGRRLHSLRVSEILSAVEQRFKNSIKTGELRISTLPPALGERLVKPEQIRHFYDLLSELTQNTIKHAGRSPAIMRLSQFDDQVMVSNLAPKAAGHRDSVEGYPYETLHDSLFGEGKSGTRKLAYLASSIVRVPVSIEVVRSPYGYHVRIPATVFGAVPGAMA